MTAPTSALTYIERSNSLGQLRHKIVARRAELVKQLADGLAADWPDYKKRLGVLHGLDDALAFIDEIEKNERN